jgi:beta/gamma crystallin
MLKRLVVTACAAAGLLALDVAQPVLTGSGFTQAAPRRGGAGHAARGRSNFARPRSNLGQRFSGPRGPRFSRGPNVRPRLRKPFTPRFNAFRKKKGPAPGPHPVFNNGPGLGKKLEAGPGTAQRAAFIRLGSRSWPIHRGPWRLWWHGGWKSFVPFTTLGAVVIGGSYYWPAGYVSIGRPYCTGQTPEGCQLNWQQVAFENGGSEWQCVQYCQRPGAPAPQNAAPPAAPPQQAPASNGRCELAIFADPQFGGVNAQSDTDQPKLAGTGWKDQIASIQVKSGTWDFFSDDDYAGETMRLAPGPYPDLGPQWSKHIGSFMCVQGN